MGHNVGYDRQRVLEQYYLDPDNTAFLDTMSMHMATSGLSSQQRSTWQQAKEKEKNPFECSDEADEVRGEREGKGGGRR